MGAFEPVGRRARWLEVYDLIRPAEVGEIVSYEAIADAIGVAPTDRTKMRSPLARAAKELLVNEKRAIVAVPNKGYQIAEPRAHLEKARKHGVKGGRQIKTGLDVAVNIDPTKMEPETRRAFEVVAGIFAMQRDFNRRAEDKIKEHDKAIQALTKATERTDTQRAELVARLERLEAITAAQ